MPNFLLLLFCFFGSAYLDAQGLAGAKNADPGVLLHLGYGPFTPAGDLAERFGNGWSIDGALTFLPKSSNLELGVRAQFGFGNQVKEDPLAGLRTTDGFLIGNQRDPADVQLRNRQLFLGLTVGYTFPIGENKRAGIHLKTSPGYFFHRIRFQDDPVQTVPQISGSRVAGYDRLTGGFAIHQFVGYQQLALDRRLNFYVGAEVMAGFTTALRSFDFATGTIPNQEGRTDILLGFKAGLIVPFYLGTGEEIFYK